MIKNKHGNKTKKERETKYKEWKLAYPEGKR